MKRIFMLGGFFVSLQIFAQDSTMNNLTKDMDKKESSEKKPVKIFSSQKVINANSTEMVGKGKMEFKVTHNFGDIGGDAGGIHNFYGLDNAADVKIGFQTGLCNRLDLITSRIRGAESYTNNYSGVQQMWELGLKYLVLQQIENDPKHPISLAIFANTAISTMQVPALDPAHRDSAETNFGGLSDRMSEVVQLIIARKFGKISLQLNPTFVHRTLIIPGDDKSIFALGGALRIPLTRNFAFIMDYFHVFHSESSKAFYKQSGSIVHPVIHFYDPLGVGFEITTAGHVFHLNFTNATEILENRFIPRTVTNWGDGQFRWGFTISRTFVLWREKK